MDPLSLTASIIAVVQAAASVEHGLAKLLAVRGANDHLLQTINEVSDLRAILHDIHATIKSRDECTMGESKALETLPALCTEIQRSIQELDTLVAGCIIYEPRDGETPWKVKRIAWLKANEKMKAIQNELRESRLKLSTAIASMLSLDLLHVRLTLREISAVSSSKSGSSDHSEALIKISKRFDGLTQIPDQISEILSILKPVSSAESSSMLIPVTSPGYGEKDRLVTRHVSSAVQPGSRLTVDRGIIRLKFGEHPHRARGCACTCHGTSTVASSPWIEGVVGRLFIGYNGQIASLRPCMECPCVRNRNTKISFTYYFPSWLLSRSLEAVLNVTRLGGPQFALRAYRSMPDETLLFHLARQGNIPEIQTLFRDGLASPFDISAKTGRSALHFAVDFGQEETCHFLLRQGADPHYEDKYFMSRPKFPHWF
ncbi:hypothetical protein BO70DRAFT_132733 [Aspergillus heteromorphus CBS 117.55]|uniref:Uncharacterized protein n=1 Tax=Aspergillus heteromorphus CBS 117.55 TaxID=1448321 RepID=A0A317X0J3_9EURO|nr:uncharacterized protein BO70DRAFT_132733 [Aspergillus heteromorphus CBS 117.55]PWY90020.1 hypothetical protein BO70DRAFT_132733 [Aspergillus heteromorphus CBS 117.55]